MNHGNHPRRARTGPAVALAAALAFLAAAPTARALVIYGWNSPISGQANDPARWTPAGIPGFDDYMHYNAAGTYTVTYNAGVPLSSMVAVGGGPVTFNLDAPHATDELLIGTVPGTATLNVAYGAMQCGYVSLGLAGALTRLTLTGSSFTGSAQLTSTSSDNRNYGGGVGDVIGEGGIAYLDVFGGAQYTCDRSGGGWPLLVAMDSNDIATIDIAGRNAMTLAYSTLRVTGNNVSTGMIVGVGGTASIYLRNGGYMDVDGNLMLAQLAGSYAYVNVGPSTVFGSARLNVRNDLWIGFNFYETVAAGRAELWLRSRSWVHVAGRCDVGDPDNDAGSFLRVAEGSTFRVNDGIKFWPTAGMPLDLRGGLTHVNGGAFLWPAGKPLVISSQVGTPELAIGSGVTSTGPSTPSFNAQLTVGRGGVGRLRLSQPGTVFAMGAGVTTVGDSTGSVGTVIVDSLATLTSGGALNLGVRGQGVLSVGGGGAVDVGAMAVGVVAGALGEAAVHGPGSLLQVRDSLWIGGGFAGSGGFGTVTADSGGVINVLHTGGVNPALTTIYAAGGALELTDGGSLVTPGNVSNSGGILLDQGLVQAASVTMTTTGAVAGNGRVAATMYSNGILDPGAGTTPYGTLEVDGAYVEFGAGRLVVDLGDDGSGAGDLLAVGGAATLAGALDLRTDPDAPPQSGQVFVILTAAGVAGAFSTVTWNGAPLADEAEVEYLPDAVRVVMDGPLSAVDPGAEEDTVLRFTRAAGGGGDLAFALDLPAAATVRIKVYDLRGREVATLQDGELGPGRHLLGDGGRGRRLASGVYIARALIAQDRRTQVLTARSVIVR
ncbi:MAG: hypothetical protein IH621_15260 [Krumholzibacteria bacterium]|nr:hypothetical protein [Candidatus Krumholzibacteria bacterium]